MKKINVILVLFLALSMALSACATEAVPTEAPVAERMTPMMDGGVAMTAEEDAQIALPFAQSIRDAIAIEDAGYIYEGYMMPSDTTWNSVKDYYTELAASEGLKLADGLMTFRFDGSEMIAFRDDTGIVMFIVYTPVSGGVAISLAYGKIK